MEGLCTSCGRLRTLVYDQWGDEWICVRCLKGGEEYPDSSDASDKHMEPEEVPKNTNGAHR